ncbi:MAG: peptidoglycan DD-metalloendopeptidase family protein [Clostridia bacterium]|jgi:murein DD-endopeptidase MepM/ murein hydrolase activator NlpD|nr:peptidoglycan DD-metalloendopeptidase family protein [Clostridia bacterium]
MFIVSKCIKYYIKRLAKVSGIMIIGLLMVASFIYIKYKPLYKVTLNGEVIGYVENKEKMQEKIEKFANNLEGNITSIKLKEMPEYELELVSDIKESETKEEEILALIKENSEIKCRTYAIKLDGNVKACVDSKQEADEVIQNIKSEVTEGIELNLEVEEQEKDKKEIENNVSSIEIAKLTINQDVEVKVQEYQKQQEAVKAAELKKQQEAQRKAAASRAANVSARSGSTAGESAQVPANSGLFMRPVSGGKVTSPYGRRSSGFHTGIDIERPNGTPIYAAASGTVTRVQKKNTGYGYLVVIDHGNGYQTYYAHCSAIYVSVGQSVSKGQNISAVGSTGNSTGNHLHFEIRYNGNTLNPQSYI